MNKFGACNYVPARVSNFLRPGTPYSTKDLPSGFFEFCNMGRHLNRHCILESWQSVVVVVVVVVVRLVSP